MKRVLVPGLLTILFTSILLTAPSEASVVWSDDFNDGNLDGWTQSGCTDYSLYQIGFVNGNATAADKNLQATGECVLWSYTYITHPTIVNTGTWSFDFHFPEDQVQTFSLVCDFMDKPTLADETWFDWNGYEIWIMSVGTIQMVRVTSPRNELNPQNAQFNDEHRGDLGYHPIGWKHIDITRESDGRWRIYLNATLILEATDNTIPAFPYFGVWLQPGIIYDDFVVKDTINVPPGSLRLTVKDSTGNVLSGAAVSSSRQPNGQTALSGTTVADGTVTFTGLAIGNYTVQVSKSSYVSGLAQGAVASGAKTELSVALQAEPLRGIPGFPITSIVIGVLLGTFGVWLCSRKRRTLGYERWT